MTGLLLLVNAMHTWCVSASAGLKGLILCSGTQGKALSHRTEECSGVVDSTPLRDYRVPSRAQRGAGRWVEGDEAGSKEAQYSKYSST